MKYWLLFSLVFWCTGISYGQRFDGFRLGTYIGVATPLGSFADKDDPFERSNGYASTGLDVGVFGELFLTKHISAGLRGGYTLYDASESSIQDEVVIDDGQQVTVGTTPYQNLNLMGTIGYSGYLVKDKLDINPYIGLGLSIFKTADREIDIADSTGMVALDYQKKSEIEPGFQVTPGLAFNYAILSFLDLRIYGEYVFADYKLTETTTIGSSDNSTSSIIRTQAVTYNLRSLNIGGGLSLRF